jgi:hypothetical protein
MLYKVSPFGYFGRVAKVSRGPWFNEWNVEEDGLEYFYAFGSDDGLSYLLSNNVPLEDRERLERLYRAYRRNKYLTWFGGLWLGAETVLRVNCFKKMAVGWRCLSLFGMAAVYKTGFQYYNGQTYGPLMSAFFRKYSEQAKPDTFAITDRKREYFNIDTTSYMNYDYKDLGHEYHVNHGPQPVRIINVLKVNIGRRSFGQLLVERIGQIP